MERLLWPVMIKMSSIPEASASSMMYWIVGLSTIGSISLGQAFVAGKKRVPKPAAGITALVIFPILTAPFLLQLLLYLFLFKHFFAACN